MTRIMGPTGSRRRRRFLLVPILCTAALALFWIAGAQAVHDLGVFQLDGDASSATQPPPPYPQAVDDWDKVCHQVAGFDCSTMSNTTGATAVAWSNDCNATQPSPPTCIANNPTKTSDRAASTFNGGGSKDPLDINNWAWNDGSGGLPDKDNLVQSFAARYNVTGSGAPTDCLFGQTCDVIYFGLDRFDNSGDAQNGFWFLQNKCGEGTNKVGGATGFTCTGDPTPGTNPSDDFHRNGDLLVVSDFRVGGTTATINVYQWNTLCTKAGQVLSPGHTCGDTNLEFLRGSANAKCSAALAGDDFCGIVNQSTITMPWSFTDKSGMPGNGALIGEFYEAGINLTALGLGGECFATLFSETRSSTSTDATLKDFIAQSFAPCVATIATSVDSSTGSTSVNPAQRVRDKATVTGTPGKPFPDGTNPVTFFLCQYNPGSTTNTCPSGSGDNIGTGSLSPNGTDANGAPQSIANSPYVNCDPASTTGCAPNPPPGTFTKNPLAPGHYCFRAEWNGDSNYTAKLVEDGTSSQECFDVTVIPTDVKTKQSWYPNDTATISSTVTGDNLAPGGTVVFTLYSDGTCGTSGGTVLYKETKTNVPSTAQHSVEVSTSNPGGGDTGTTSYADTTAYTDSTSTTTGPHSWKVEYTKPAGDVAHTGVSSSCTAGHTESHTYTYQNDPGGH